MSDFYSRRKMKPTGHATDLSSPSSKKDKKTVAFGRKKNIEDYLPKLKEQRHKKMIHRLIPLLLLFSFAILVVIYFISPLSKIDEISVSGTSSITDQEVINVSSLKTHESLWPAYFSKKKTEKKIIDNIPQVRGASLTLNGLNDFQLTIDEFKTVGYLHEGPHYYTILENGKIVDESRTVSIGNDPVFKSFKEGKALKLLIKQYALLSPSIQNAISEIEAVPSKNDPYLIRLYMNDGKQVIASIPTFAEKMNYYPDMVKKIGNRKGTINIEIGGYFEPFEQKEPDEEDFDEEDEENFNEETE
ncbi:cell division protein FtsQ/DivIB [Pisciglobus halotolerans]|uniref:Cell division protein DivIB n=1 Tax=Pisciglobus halotolerans TaxID=745365 RepID=A0A1I3BWZ6_9LACT|nr:cell division protein FtsQ/DivIB [Pisciglobus halotolerans]SFH66576.1 cell division protein FtsQ [Pisciglobus halotolerans]